MKSRRTLQITETCKPQRPKRSPADLNRFDSGPEKLISRKPNTFDINQSNANVTTSPHNTSSVITRATDHHLNRRRSNKHLSPNTTTTTTTTSTRNRTRRHHQNRPQPDPTTNTKKLNPRGRHTTNSTSASKARTPSKTRQRRRKRVQMKSQIWTNTTTTTVAVGKRSPTATSLSPEKHHERPT
ncbi:hypothetical protein QL285_078735 [Trifolium repens]|nr:hypothetical protein QL285_078735 [Trifolium repens]